MLNALIIVTALLQAYNLGLVNLTGRVNRGIMILVYVGYLIIEGWLAVSVTWTMWLFVALNLFVIVTAVAGLLEEWGNG